MLFSKAVDKISKFNEYINNLSVVKSTKKVCKFCEEWLGGVEEPASNKRNLLSYDDIVKMRNSGSKPEWHCKIKSGSHYKK